MNTDTQGTSLVVAEVRKAALEKRQAPPEADKSQKERGSADTDFRPLTSRITVNLYCFHSRAPNPHLLVLGYGGSRKPTPQPGPIPCGSPLGLALSFPYSPHPPSVQTTPDRLPFPAQGLSSRRGVGAGLQEHSC